MEVVKNNETEEITKDSFLKNVIYLGIQGREDLDKSLKLLAKEFPQKHIYIMDKAMYSKVGFMFVEQHLKWKEQQKLQEYVNDPAKMQDAMGIMMKIVEKIGENRWFYLKDVVTETNMTYPQASSTLDLLFAFGMSATRKDPENIGREQYKIIKDERAKLVYVEELAEGLEQEAKQLRTVAETIKEEIRNSTAPKTLDKKKSSKKAIKN